MSCCDRMDVRNGRCRNCGFVWPLTALCHPTMDQAPFHSQWTVTCGCGYRVTGVATADDARTVIAEHLAENVAPTKAAS